MKEMFVFLGVLLFLFANIFHVSASLNVTLSDQGSNVVTKSTGLALTSGDLSVYIYDAAAGGNLVYSENFTSGIVNGSWNLILGENSSNPLSLEFGKAYYKDYYINAQNLGFTSFSGTTSDRQLFYSPLGDIAGSYVKQNANLTIYNLSAAGNVSAMNFLGNLTGNINGYSSSYFFPVNASVAGTFDFNGNWQTGGLTIQGGSIYAQAGYFYNISSLQINQLEINGSLFPYPGYSNTFDLGNSSLMWNELWLGGNANISGDVFASRLIGNLDYSNITNPFNFTSATFTTYNSTWDSRYLIADVSTALSNNITSVNTTKNIQELLNSTGIYNQGTGFAKNTTAEFQQSLNNSNMYFSSLGIGITSPTHLLNVFGNTNLSGNVYLGNSSIVIQNGNLNVSGNITLDNAGIGGPTTVTKSGLWIKNSTGDPTLVFYKASANALRIDNQGDADTVIDLRNGKNFQVYNTSSATTTFYAMGSGKVGIGTSSPVTSLDVSGTIRSINQVAPTSDMGIEIIFNRGGNNQGYVTVYNRSGGYNGILNLNDVININGSSGRVGVGMTPGHAIDVVSATNDVALASSTVWISRASDSRIKTNISNFTDGMDLINKINPIKYNYNGITPEGNDKTNHVGLFADQLNEIAPGMAVPRSYTITEKDMEVINKIGIDRINKNTPYPLPKNLKVGDTITLYGWSSNEFFFVFINAFKEQQRMIELQNQTIQIYEQRFKELCEKDESYSWC